MKAMNKQAFFRTPGWRIRLAGILLAGLAAVSCEDSSFHSDVPPPGSDLASAVHLFARLGNSSSRRFGERQYYYLDGSPISSESLAGRPVLVNYWASWCAPCTQELPLLLAIADLLGDELLVLLASDESPEVIEAFLSRQLLPAMGFVRLQGSFGENSIMALPLTLLFSSDGSYLYNWQGARDWDTPAMLAEIRALLAL